MPTSRDIFRPRPPPLEPLFAPKRVAVVGASEREGSVGRQVLANLVATPFGGTVFPVSRTRESVLGIRAYASVGELPEKPDLAVIAVPAANVPEVARDCGDAGARAAVILSAGFREVGATGEALEERILAEARRTGMRVVGPSSLGVIRPPTGLDASFARSRATPGRVAFLSQSGALLSAVLDWSGRENVGFSALVSAGSLLDVGWGDLIAYLGDDPHTSSILIYMETIGDARSFLSAAREVALRKPVIVMKAGRAPEIADAVVSHTGALAGSDEALDAAFRRTGVLRVDRVADLFHTAEVLAKQPRPRGPRLAILTNAVGPGLIAADALLAGRGHLASLSESSREAVDELLPAGWNRSNPVDLRAAATPETYRRVLDVLADDDGNDGVLVVLAPQHATDATHTAKLVAERAHLGGKPLLASWMGGETTSEGDQVLDRAGVATFRYPDTAARIFDYMWRYTYNLRGIYETPALRTGDDTRDARETGQRVIDGARRAGRNVLEPQETKDLLAAYGIPVVDSRPDPDAYELVIASQTDDQLGPVLLFGAGGPMVDVYRDVALGLPPLTQTLARRMIEQTRVSRALGGIRGRPPVDRTALEALLVRFAQLVAELRPIAEIHIDPLLACRDRVCAFDARVTLHPADRPVEALPPLAIRPYPTQYAGTCTAKDGTEITVRPIRPEDEPALVRFHETLSEDSVHMRYSSMMSLDARTAHERLSRICFVDWDREMVLIAEQPGDGDGREMIGVARLNRTYGTRDAEFAVLVSDRHQGKGLGRELLSRLVDIGRAEGLERIVGYILPQNAPMLRTCRSLGFEMAHDPVEETVTAVKVL